MNETSDHTLRLNVGLGSIDDFPSYVKAGADEVFCGYIPYEWANRYGLLQPLNRREVLYYNVQIGSASELQILRRMAEDSGVPVNLTLNALSYDSESYPRLLSYMLDLKAMGFERFIIADLSFLRWLSLQGMKGQFRIHISGEIGEMNRGVLEECAKYDASRIIYHRRVLPADMASLTSRHPGLEYEAFLMNELCHFHGGYCNSLHCDELCHMCLLPYETGPIRKFEGGSSPTPEAKPIDLKLTDPDRRPQEAEFSSSESYIPGHSGCGLCALPLLAGAGVGYLKIVSRGQASQDTLRDIAAAKKAISLLQEYPQPDRYERVLKQQLFGNLCSRNCYYPM